MSAQDERERRWARVAVKNFVKPDDPVRYEEAGNPVPFVCEDARSGAATGSGSIPASLVGSREAAPILPPFDPSMSDGCSMIPWWPRRLGRKRFQRWALRFVVRDVGAAEAICGAHDLAYYLGGTRDDRTDADLQWLDAMREIDRTPGRRFSQVGFIKIRRHGGPEGRIPGVSWAWGGGRFEYDA